ncbi:MAG: hypothetical protein WCJ30_04040 [Deltaproteobacteria bacterium]
MIRELSVASVLAITLGACGPAAPGPDASSDALSEAGVSCAYASPAGPGVPGLTVEGCTFEGGPPGVEVDTELRALALEPGGNALYVVYGPTSQTAVERFIDDTGPGCHLRRDRSWSSPLPATETALYADVASDGSVYVASESMIAWSIGRTGSCAASAQGLGARASMQVASDYRIVAPDGVGPARLLDTTTCAYSDATFGPTPALGAARVGTDYVFVTGSNHVQRFDAAGTMRWTGAGTLAGGTEIRPCGADVCVLEATTPALARISGTDGSRVTAYPAASLFGASFGGTVRIDACPSGTTFSAAWVGASDAACPPPGGRQRAVGVVRMRGF